MSLGAGISPGARLRRSVLVRVGIPVLACAAALPSCARAGRQAGYSVDDAFAPAPGFAVVADQVHTSVPTVAGRSAAGAGRPYGYSVDDVFAVTRGFAEVTDRSRPPRPSAVGIGPARAIAPPERRIAAGAVQRDDGRDAAAAPLTLAFRCPARVRACPATEAALAHALRDAGIAVAARDEAGEWVGHRGVSYVFEEDRVEALRIAGLVFGTEAAEQVPARAVRDPRPGLVGIDLAG